MFSEPYKDIPEHISSCMESFIDKNDEYHNVSHKRRYARTIQILLDQQPKGKLLELGTSELLPRCLSVLSPDLEVFVTDFNLEKPLAWGKEIGEHIYQAFSLDLEKSQIPTLDSTFDYVICSEVIEHMEIDPMFMLSEVNRVLKPEGVLILTTPNAVSSHSLTKMLLGIEPYFFMQYHKPGNYHRHNYEYSVHTLVSILKAAGFDGSIWTEDTFEDPITSTVEKLKNQGYKINHTGDNIFAVAKKKHPVIDRYPKVIYV